MLHSWRCAWGLRDLVKIPANKLMSLVHLLYLRCFLINCKAFLTVQRKWILSCSHCWGCQRVKCIVESPKMCNVHALGDCFPVLFLPCLQKQNGTRHCILGTAEFLHSHNHRFGRDLAAPHLSCGMVAPTSSGCPRFDPAWPWAFPGIGHP